MAKLGAAALIATDGEGYLPFSYPVTGVTRRTIRAHGHLCYGTLLGGDNVLTVGIDGVLRA